MTWGSSTSCATAWVGSTKLKEAMGICTPRYDSPRPEGSGRSAVVTFAWVAPLLAIAGCGEPDPEGGGEEETFPAEDLSEPATLDSAGIQIVESSAAALRAELAWEVEEAPHLSLGGPGAASPEAFGGIAPGGVGMREGQRLIALDTGSHELRLFDWDGGVVEITGGEGDGPGEFRTPRLARTPGNDSIAVWDRGHNRVTLFLLDDGYVEDRETYTVDAGTGGDVVGVVGGRALQWQWHHMLPGPAEQPAPVEMPKDLVLVDLETEEEWHLEVGAEPDRYRAEDGAVTVRTAVLQAPFSVGHMAASGLDRVYAAGPERPEVREYDLDGELRRIFRIDVDPEVVTDEVLEGWIEADVARREAAGYDPERFDDYRRLFQREDMPVPEHVPTFQDLRVDDEGRVWAELYGLPDQDAGRWLVFDPGGRAQGIVRMPAGLDVHHIGRNYVVGVTEDELDVEYLVRHRVHRSDTEDEGVGAGLVRIPASPRAAVRHGRISLIDGNVPETPRAARE